MPHIGPSGELSSASTCEYRSRCIFLSIVLLALCCNALSLTDNLFLQLHLPKTYCSSEGLSEKIVTQSAITAAVQLTSEEQIVYASWQKVIECWGWKLSCKNPARLGGEQTLALPSVYGRLLGAADFKAYLGQLLDSHRQGEVPTAVQKVLASVACRHAYMFNDSLDISQGQELLEKLRGTQLWFQCAHGRPTSTPLVNIGAPRIQKAASLSKKGQGGRGIDIGQLRAKLTRHMQACWRKQESLCV